MKNEFEGIGMVPAEATHPNLKEYADRAQERYPNSTLSFVVLIKDVQEGLCVPTALAIMEHEGIVYLQHIIIVGDTLRVEQTRLNASTALEAFAVLRVFWEINAIQETGINERVFKLGVYATVQEARRAFESDDLTGPKDASWAALRSTLAEQDSSNE